MATQAAHDRREDSTTLGFQFPKIAKTYEPTMSHHLSDSVVVNSRACLAEDVCLAWALLVNHLCDEQHVAFGVTFGGQSTECPYVSVKVEETFSLDELRCAVAYALHQHNATAEMCDISSLQQPRCEISTMLAIDDTAHESKGSLGHGEALLIQCQISPQFVNIHACYDSAVIGQKQMSSTFAYFQQLLANVIDKGATTPIRELKGCSTSSQLYLEEFNSGVMHSTNELFHDVFAQQARSQPSKPAICSSDGEITYEQLDQLSGLIAWQLHQRGVGPESIVPLGFSKSWWAVVAMLAVAKASGAFVFLDCNAPPKRNNECLRHATVDFILTSESDCRFQGLKLNKIINIEELGVTRPNAETEERWKEDAHPGNLLYVIFTSGSTGPPKAVAITHSAFCSSAMYHSKAMFMTCRSRVFQFSNFTFDVSLLEILTTLSVGGCVCIPTDHDRINDIAGSMERMCVNWAVLTPSVARVLDVTRVPSLGTLVFAGEAVRTKDLVRWRSRSHEKRILMCYGPSECSIISTVTEADLTNPVPEDLGFRTGCALWIVDKRDPNILLPYGAEGELLVEGPNVGRGYLSMPERTTQSWIDAPKWARSAHHDYHRRRFYLSGDICKLAENGSVYFVRRKDSQVKLRGQRIALEEVEAKLEELLPGFVLAADIVHYEEEQTDRTLLFGFVAETYGDSDAATLLPRSGMGSLLDTTMTRLSKLLPPYMIPSAMVPLSVLPLNRSGKLDRRRLKSLVETASTTQLFGKSAENAISGGVLTDAETQLRSLWSQALSIPAHQIGVYDHFFKLGADSITAIKLVSLAQRARLAFTVADVLNFPTLAELASIATTMKMRELSEPVIPEAFSMLYDKEQVLTDICEEYLLCRDTIEDVLPCTPMQEGLMLSSMRSPGTYIGQETYELPDEIDITRFKTAWAAVCSALPIWRTRIVASREGKIFQAVIREEIEWQESTDLTDITQSQNRESMSMGGRLVRFGLVFDEFQRASHFVMTAHHSLYDAWTLALTFDRFERIYFGLQARILLPMSSFVEQLASPSSNALAFWSNYLDDFHSSPFPESDNRQAGIFDSQSLETHIMFDMPAASEWTAFTMVKTAWAILVNHFTACDDILFGTTVSGRHAPLSGIDSVCGPTIATVPCRVQIKRSSTLRDLLNTIHKDAADIIPHEQAGLQAIQRIGDDIRRACDFGCLLLMQMRKDGSDRASEVLGRRCSAEDAARTNSYTMTLDFSPTHRGFDITAGFDARSLDSTRVETIIRHLEHILRLMTPANEVVKVSELPTIRHEDFRLVRDWNTEATMKVKEMTAHGLIESQARLQPHVIAVSSWDGGDTTYERLWKLSDCLAVVLRSHGVSRDTVVPLVFEKSVWTVVAMLSVLRAGGGFVSLDPNGPQERAFLICDEVKAHIALSSTQHKEFLLGKVKTCVTVDSNTLRGIEHDVSSEDIAATTNSGCSPSDLMYAIFTSGSTGTPKGCLIEHRSFTTAALAVASAHQMSAHTRTLQFSNYTFDVAIEDIFTTLIVGGCVCIPGQDELNNELSTSISKYRSNHIELTPTVVNLVDFETAETLKTVIVSGESASKMRLPADVQSKVRIINSYGLSETSITNFVSGDFSLRNPEDIGRSVACGAWIVDTSDPHRLLPIGAEGELLISGDVLARGYLGQPEKTAECFIEPPQWAEGFASASSRFYKTGDLARFTSDGRAILLGRKDQQVKLNGLRIELLEVESHIQRHLPHHSTFVEVFGHGTNTDRSTLVAFLVKRHSECGDPGLSDGRNGTAAGYQHSPLRMLRSEETLEVNRALKAHLLQVLPSYMVPSMFVHIDKKPLTPAGKVDQRLLRDLVKLTQQQNISDARNTETGTLAVWSPAEVQVRNVWAKTLGLAEDSITQNDHFFVLGGDSVTAMAVVAAMGKQSWNITVACVFQNPVLRGLARAIKPAQKRLSTSHSRTINGVGPGLTRSLDSTNVPSDPRYPRLSQTKADRDPPSSPAGNGILANGSFRPASGSKADGNRGDLTSAQETQHQPTLETSFAQGTSCTVLQASKILNVSEEDIEDLYPCTPIQQGFMVLSSRDGSYKSNTALQIRPDVDITRLKDSWQFVVSKVAIWRTQIVQSLQGHLMQVVLPRTIVWHERTVASFSTFFEQAPLPSMDFGQDLSHFLLVRESTTNVMHLIISHHHAVYDGLSLQDTISRVSEVYHESPIGRIVPFKSFVEHVGTEDARLAKSSDFWASYFRGVECLPFPTASGQRIGDLTNKTVRKDIRFRWNDKLRCTTFTIVKAAWTVLAHEYTSSDDVVFGATLNGQNAPLEGIEDVTGPTITTVPLRMKFDRHLSLGQFLEQIQLDAIEMMPHEQSGLHTIRKINEETNLGCQFNTLIVFQGAEEVDDKNAVMQRLPDTLDADNMFNSYLLTLEVLTNTSGIQVVATYDSSVLSEARVNQILVHLEHVMSRLNGSTVSTPLESLLGINEHDLQQIEVWNVNLAETPSTLQVCIHDAVSVMAQRHPHKTAIHAWDGKLSYENLENMATNLSFRILEFGVTQGTIVLLCFEKSLWAVVSMLAVLKSGCAFASIDPRSPISRLEKVRDLTSANFGLCSTAHASIYEDLAMRSLVVNEGTVHGPGSLSSRRTACDVSPDSLAYVIFTSGSSGTPKGVAIEHKAYISNAYKLAQALGMTSETRTLNFANSTFDTSIEEICTTLLVGGCVCIPSSTDCSNDLSRAIADYQVTLADLTPSVAALLEADVTSSLQTVILGGELATSTLDDCRQRGIAVKNSYGLTEASITNTVASDISTNGPANIGRPVGCRIWIVNSKDHDVLAPIGAEGEILIEGPCLARGYLNDPEKTCQTFIDNPSFAGQMESRRFYKTGDIARYHDDGSIIYCRRKDNQVKLRGLRIELGEVESQLDSALPAYHVAVEVVSRIGESQTTKALVGYFADRTLPFHETTDIKVLSSSELRQRRDEATRALSSVLPAYMIPSALIPLSYMPLNSSGKMDRKRLRLMTESMSDEVVQDISGSNAEKDSPESKSGRDLQNLWAQVLGIPLHKIGINDNFFHIGGDSIKAMQLVAAGRPVGVKLTVAKIFQHPILHDMGQRVDVKEASSTSESIVHSQKAVILDQKSNSELEQRHGKRVELTDFQILCTRSLFRETAGFLTYVTIRYDRKIDKRVVRRACQNLVDTTQVLRTVLVNHPQQPYGIIMNSCIAAFETLQTSVELSTFSKKLIAFDQLVTPSEDHPPSSFWFIEGQKYDGLIVRLSHAQFDGLSLPILFQGLDERSNTDSRPMTFYTDAIKSLDLRAGEKYWYDLLRGSQMTPVPGICHDSRQPEKLREVERWVPAFDPEIRGFTFATYLKAAWGLVLAEASETSDVVFGHLVSGRAVSLDDIEKVNGPCVNFIPIRIDVTRSPRELLHQVHEQQITSMHHETLGFGSILRKCTDWQLGSDLTPRFTSIVQHQNLPDDCETIDLHGATCEVSYEATPTNVTDMWVITEPSRGGFNVSLNFFEPKVDSKVATHLLEQLCHNLDLLQKIR